MLNKTEPSLRSLLALSLAAVFCIAPSALAENQELATTNQPLRLQDTIRGNKEQPKVLSIVPWQLPKHRQIDNTLDWQPQLMQPTMLERQQFLQRLKWQRRLSADAQTTDASTR